MLRTLYDSIVYVKVGPERQSFGFHKALLCRRSAYFKAALNGNFKEAEDGVVILDDEDPHLFQVFNEWLYTGEFFFDCQGSDLDEKNSAQWSAMLDLYIFPEKRVIPKLQNDLVDTMWKFAQEMHHYPSIEVTPAWAQTAKTSPLHTFLVDLYVYHADLQDLFHDYREKFGSFPIDFVMGVAKESNELAFCDDRTTDFSMWNNRCNYHVHQLSEPLCEGGNEPGLLRPGH